MPYPLFNSYHKIMPTRPMVRRVSRHPRADIIFAAIGICVCAMFAVYFAVHFLIGLVEFRAIEQARDERMKNDGIHLHCRGKLWSANARAIDFSKVDD